VREYTLLWQLEGLSPEQFHIGVEDGHQLSFADASSAKIHAISVIEHIPGDGDSMCLREIGRVLAPGGRCVITVPFAPTSRAIYKKARDVYWAQSTGVEEDGRVFFQRRYSEEDLFARVIIPSGLRLCRLRYVGENILTGSARELGEVVLPIILTLLGPVQPLLSRIFHTLPADTWQELRKPLCALVVLEKPLHRAVDLAS